jgi:ABC-type multidrug transport system fused ATPase/permease subunit
MYMTSMLESVAEVQAGMNSVERLDEYATGLPDEGARHVEGAVGSAWPTDGSIEVDGVDMRYRPGLPLALHGLTFAIRSGEKIGIVGRTGAGKSSLTNLLLRLVNPEAGTVHISGLDVAHIGLHDLRRAIAVIPQDPTLFLGSLRFNLDPSTDDAAPDPDYDARMLAALRAVRLIPGVDGDEDDSPAATALPSGESSDTEGRPPSPGAPKVLADSGPLRNLTLDTRVESEGKNFSTGHRQLIALARAIIRDTRIVLIDEATSNVDLRSDTHVQEMIRGQFADRTVITIAHRLRTILAYDRVMVMDSGRVVEMGTPAELFERGAAAAARKATAPAATKRDAEEAVELKEEEEKVDESDAGVGVFYEMCAKSQITEDEIRRAHGGDEI